MPITSTLPQPSGYPRHPGRRSLSHYSGCLPAGCLAGLIGRIVAGDDLDRALDRTLKQLAMHRGSDQTLRALEAARRLAAKGNPGTETVALLGAGWVGQGA